jgi:hypothetical protein
LAEAHGLDAHAFGGDASVDLAAVTDFHALLGVTAIIDVREILTSDFQALRVDAKGAAAVVQ